MLVAYFSDINSQHYNDKLTNLELAKQIKSKGLAIFRVILEVLSRLQMTYLIYIISVLINLSLDHAILTFFLMTFYLFLGYLKSVID